MSWQEKAVEKLAELVDGPPYFVFFFTSSILLCIGIVTDRFILQISFFFLYSVIGLIWRYFKKDLERHLGNGLGLRIIYHFVNIVLLLVFVNIIVPFISTKPRGLFNWLDLHSGSVLAVLTFFLVLITALYAIWTRQMANTMARQVELDAKPYTGFDRDISLIFQEDSMNPGKIAMETEWVEVKYLIMNLGKVPVLYRVSKVFFNGDKYTPASTEVVLYPGQTMYYTTKSFSLQKTKPSDIRGRAGIEIFYWGLDTPSKKYYSLREFKISNISSYTIERDDAGEVKNHPDPRA